MPRRFIPVEEITDPSNVALGLSGPSGTGKTYTALRVARGMARELDGPSARFALLDTENGRGRHYRSDFPELLYGDFRARNRSGEIEGFPVDRWLAAIDDAEAEGIRVLAIDSFSHSWEGVNGVLDTQAKVLAELTGGDESLNDRKSQLAWARVKPGYRRLLERLIGADLNVIVCQRAKPVLQKREGREMVNARTTKTRRKDIPWDVAGDPDLMFELTAMVMLSPDVPGAPGWLIKAPDGLRPMFDPQARLDEELGRRLIQWSKGSDEAEKNKRTLDAAREAARKGREALEAHWKGLNAGDKFRVRSILDECKALAAGQEAREKEDRAGVFAQDDENARREAEAIEEARREQEARDREAEGRA